MVFFVSPESLFRIAGNANRFEVFRRGPAVDFLFRVFLYQSQFDEKFLILSTTFYLTAQTPL